MGLLEDISREEQRKQEIWDKLPEYEALGMTEDDIDLDIADEDR